MYTYIYISIYTFVSHIHHHTYITAHTSHIYPAHSSRTYIAHIHRTYISAHTSKCEKWYYHRECSVCIYIYIYTHVYVHVFYLVWASGPGRPGPPAGSAAAPPRIYIYVCTIIYIYITVIHIYIYIEREREIHAYYICRLRYYIILYHIVSIHRQYHIGAASSALLMPLAAS